MMIDVAHTHFKFSAPWAPALCKNYPTTISLHRSGPLKLNADGGLPTARKYNVCSFL